MERISATDAKQSFGKLLDKASREAVLIEKNGHEYAVMLPIADFRQLEELEDAYWEAQVENSLNDEPLGVEASEILIREALRAKD